MAHAHCMLEGYKHILRICSTYCFSSATMVARIRLNVTLHCRLVSCPKNRKTNLLHRNIFSENGQLLNLFLQNLWEILQISSFFFLYLIFVWSWTSQTNSVISYAFNTRLLQVANYHARSLVTDFQCPRRGSASASLHGTPTNKSDASRSLIRGGTPKAAVRLRVLKLTRTEQSLQAFHMTVPAERADVSTVF
jgi:hypothetical protein